MTEEVETTGLDRRQLLRRGAMVGGALVWATPVVQSLTPAAYANGSPRGGGGAPSFVMLVLLCDNTYSSVKIENNGANGDCGVFGGNGPAQNSAKAIIDAQLPAGVTWASLVGEECIMPTFEVTPNGLKINHAGCSVAAWALSTTAPATAAGIRPSARSTPASRRTRPRSARRRASSRSRSSPPVRRATASQLRARLTAPAAGAGLAAVSRAVGLPRARRPVGPGPPARPRWTGRRRPLNAGRHDRPER